MKPWAEEQLRIASRGTADSTPPGSFRQGHAVRPTWKDSGQGLRPEVAPTPSTVPGKHRLEGMSRACVMFDKPTVQVFKLLLGPAIPAPQG